MPQTAMDKVVARRWPIFRRGAHGADGGPDLLSRPVAHRHNVPRKRGSTSIAQRERRDLRRRLQQILNPFTPSATEACARPTCRAIVTQRGNDDEVRRHMEMTTKPAATLMRLKD